MSDNRADIILGVRNAALKRGLSEAQKWVGDFRSQVTGAFAGALAFGGLMAGLASVIEYAKQVRDL